MPNRSELKDHGNFVVTNHGWKQVNEPGFGKALVHISDLHASNGEDVDTTGASIAVYTAMTLCADKNNFCAMDNDLEDLTAFMNINQRHLAAIISFAMHPFLDEGCESFGNN